MRTKLLVLIPMIALILASATAGEVAQQPVREGKPVVESMERLCKELGLTKKQSDSIRAIAKKFEQETGKVAASKMSEQSKKAKIEALAAEAQKRIVSLLSPEQKKKLERMKSAVGKTAIGSSDESKRRLTYAEAVQAALNHLNLSREQKTKTSAIMRDYEARRAAIKGNAKLAAGQKKAKMDALKAETSSKICAVLTPEQQKKFKERTQHGLIAAKGRSAGQTQSSR